MVKRDLLQIRVTAFPMNGFETFSQHRCRCCQTNYKRVTFIILCYGLEVGLLVNQLRMGPERDFD